MRPELDALLCERYPKIFRDRHAPMTETAMCWGFDCGDGWFDILDVLCGSIQRRVDNARVWCEEAGKMVPLPQVVAEQVKEKFGGLRFYFYGGDSHVAGMVEMAEYMSARTCEECGRPGVLCEVGGTWLLARCDEHAWPGQLTGS